MTLYNVSSGLRGHYVDVVISLAWLPSKTDISFPKTTKENTVENSATQKHHANERIHQDIMVNRQ